MYRKATTLRLGPPAREQAGPSSQVSSTISWPDRGSGKLYYRASSHALVPRVETVICAVLAHAMRARSALEIDAPVFARFASSLSTAQGILATWVPELRVVPIQINEISNDAATGQTVRPKVASFFSGGIDSLYTLIKHRDEIDTLVFVHGFDVRLQDRRLREEVSGRLRETAAGFAKDLIQVETNVRDFIDSPRISSNFHNWELLHGMALASVAHTLPNAFRKIYIPATHTYSQLYPWGSHPLLDPLWSTDQLEVVHDGCEASRLQKCELIARHELALANLRVCWQNDESAYNCGRCEKCVRTMLGLLAVGALERCPSFDSPLELGRLARRKIDKPNIRRHYDEILKRLLRESGDRRVVAAIEQSLKPRSALRRMVEALWSQGRVLRARQSR